MAGDSSRGLSAWRMRGPDVAAVGLSARLGGGFPIICGCVALVGELIASVLDPVAFVHHAVAPVGVLIAFVGSTVAVAGPVFAGVCCELAAVGPALTLVRDGFALVSKALPFGWVLGGGGTPLLGGAPPISSVRDAL